MNVGELYGFVLIIVLVAVLVGVGVLILDKMAATTGITTTAGASLNSGRDALTTINTQWLSIVVLIGIAAIIIRLLVGSFSMGGRR